MSKIVDRTFDFLELFGRERRPLLLSEMAQLLKHPDFQLSRCHNAPAKRAAIMYEIAPRAGDHPTRRLNDLAKEIADNDPIITAGGDCCFDPCATLWMKRFYWRRSSGLNATYLLFVLNLLIRYEFAIASATISSSLLRHLRSGKALLSILGRTLPLRLFAQIGKACAANK